MGVSHMSLLAFVACLARLASAGLFLAKLPEPDLKQVLLAEIEAAIGNNLHDVTKQRLTEIREALQPTFDVLPKSSEGTLDHDGTRYLLNRVFAMQHGWFINGLQAGAETWNSSLQGLSMRDHLPEVLQELFEARVGEKGASLQEVVAFAAMIEHLIRDELRGKLETVYNKKEIALDGAVDQTQALNFMEVYMICFLRGEDASAWSPVKMERLERNFHRQYPEWEGVKYLIREVQQATAPEKGSFTFDDVAGILEIVADRFASFYESQCHDLKGALLDMEDRRSGRVRLGDFYHAALNDGWYQFTETIEVLRHIGTLDEVDPSNPRVIIPNYIAGMSNCIARTSFYSTCCPNTCESLLNRIEQALGKSEATPAEITAAVEDPTAALETGFRGLSPWQRQRLNDLARHHNGRVPLHGRLFAQWMHFVHPRDCTYPHLSGTTYKKSLDDWEKDLGKSSGLTMSELQNVTQQLSERAAPPSESHHMEHEHTDNMWTMEEELFVERPSAVDAAADAAVVGYSGPAKTVFCVAALGVLGVMATLVSPDASAKKPRRSSNYDAVALAAKNV
jgi:hypothetical protein